MARAVDPRAWKPKYAQVADDLRDRIESGEFQPSDSLPSEADLAHDYDVSQLTVRRALGIIEDLQLISREQGVRAWVREVVERSIVDLQEGDELEVRAATPDERRRFGLGEREPITEVRRASGDVELYVGFTTKFRVTGPSEEG